MAVVGTLMVLIAGNNAPLAASLAASQGQLKTFSATAGSAFVPVGGAAIVAGAAAAVGMGMAINAAASFQEQMATVNTIADLTPERLTAIGDELRDLSTATGIGLPDLTQGLYDLLSVGVPVARAMEFLGDATTLSIGGVSTAGEAVDAITTAINSWSIAGGEANLTMSDSAKVMDIFAVAIAKGGMTAADLPGAIANVASSAAALNVPLEEVGAMWAIMTTKGFTASEAATSMDAALTALQKRPPGMEKLEEATGKSYEAIARTQGAQAAMQELVSDAQEFGMQLVDVFGRKEALAYARMITDVGAPAFEAALAEMFEPTGTAAGQMERRMGTFSRQMDILGTSINNLGISIGTGLLPFVTDLVGQLNGIVTGVTDWAEANPELAGSILPVITGVGLLAVAALGVSAVVGALASPIVLFVLAIGIAAGIVMTHMDDLKAGIQAVMDWLQRMIDLAKLGADTIAGIPGVKAVSDTVGGITRAGRGDFGPTGEAMSFAARFEAMHGRRPSPLEFGQMQAGTLPGFTNRGESQAMFGGGTQANRTTLNNTTNVYLDGQKVGEFVDKRLFNNASQYSSGFNRGALE